MSPSPIRTDSIDTHNDKDEYSSGVESISFAERCVRARVRAGTARPAQPGTAAAQPPPLLDSATHNDHDQNARRFRESDRVGVKVYPQAKQVTLYVRTDVDSERNRGVRHEAENPERSMAESVRRSRAAFTRYVTCNRLVFMWSLTLAPEHLTYDMVELAALWSAFVRRMDRRFGVGAWAKVIEFGTKNGRPHFHVALAEFVLHSEMLEVWGLGGVQVEGPTRQQRKHWKEDDWLDDARRVGRYMAKYLGKDFDGAVPDANRYSVAQNFQPVEELSTARTFDEAITAAAEACGTPGAEAVVTFDSNDLDDWDAPRVLMVQFGGRWRPFRRETPQIPDVNGDEWVQTG